MILMRETLVVLGLLLISDFTSAFIPAEFMNDVLAKLNDSRSNSEKLGTVA